MTRRPGRRERGQILPLFALSLVVMLSFAALLFDGANSLVQRRRLQNAGDAAALAASNLIQLAGSSRKCSDTAGPPPGSPRAEITAAAIASVTANLPGFDTSNITVTCAPLTVAYNVAVQVDLRVPPTNWFARAIGLGGNSVGTTSVAVNGRTITSRYNVVVLDTSNLGWPSGRRGCPSFLISGGPTITFDGSAMLNSSCIASNGGALGTNGSSATVTFTGGASINMVGTYSPGPLTITPTPVPGQTAIKDPLRDLEAPSTSGMIVQKSAKHVVNGTTETLSPGIYQGGIELRSSAKVFLRPGIYYIDGGELSVGAQAELCSITATAAPSNCTAGWAADCPDNSCGVLIYKNVKTTDNFNNDRINVGAGATLKLRAYDERANGNLFPEYRNLLLWQSATPVPTNTYAQPWVQLSGGGSVDVSGTVYTPSAKVLMGGGSGGSGGTATNVTLQFIVWDMEMSGNADFHFYYNAEDFAALTDYGLIQ